MEFLHEALEIEFTLYLYALWSLDAASLGAAVVIKKFVGSFWWIIRQYWR